jgi:hypothetical protein
VGERYNDSLESQNENYPSFIPISQRTKERTARDNADKNLKHDMDDLIKQIEGEGEHYKENNYDEGIICYHFFRAWQIKPGTVTSGMSYDPERVEIEDPLMHGEPYPEII